MTDQTTADDEHVCKPGASIYFCPTSGETESSCHGGFDACCDRPDLHQPTHEACQQLAEKLDTVRATAEAWARPSMSAPSRAAGEHLLRVLSAEAADQTTPLRDRIAEAALTAVEAALGDTLVPVARAEALAGIAAVLPAPADRAADLREAADELDARMERFFSEWPDEPRNSPYALGQKGAANELRRMADEQPAAGARQDGARP